MTSDHAAPFWSVPHTGTGSPEDFAKDHAPMTPEQEAAARLDGTFNPVEEARGLLRRLEAIRLTWCVSCGTFVVPLNRFQDQCPRCRDLLPSFSPSAVFHKEKK